MTILTGPFDSDIMKGIGTGLYFLWVLVARIVMVLILPISAPIIAWLLLRQDQRVVGDADKARARLRRGIHQNGPSV